MFDDDDRDDTTAEDRQEELERQRTIDELGGDPEDLGCEDDPWDLYRHIDADDSDPMVQECFKVES